MKHVQSFLTFLCIITSTHTSLNAMLPSCSMPIDYTTATTITLTQDIILDGVCELITVSDPFGTLEPEEITFTATQPYKIIVTKNGTWNMQSFNTQNKIIKFAGSASLELQQGGTLRFNGGKIVLADNTKTLWH